MQSFILEDFLARSTDTPWSETTLAKVLADLPPLSDNGPWIGGGALRRTLLGQEPDSDFDFFFHDADQLRIFGEALSAKGFSKVRETEHHRHYRGRAGGGPERDVQLIRFAFYPDAESVIDSFDFTICQLSFDGRELLLGDHTLWDLGRRRLAVHKITFPVSSMRRVLKYAKQGFTACNGCRSTLLQATATDPSLRTDIAYVD